MDREPLTALFEATNRRACALDVLRTLALAIAIGVAVVLAAFGFDAAFPLSLPLRIAVDLGLAAFGIAAFGMLVRVFLEHPYEPRRIARQIEERLGIKNSTLINAVELEEATAHSGSEELRRQSIEIGAQAAAAVDPRRAVSFAPLTLAAKWTGLALVACLVLVFLAPRLIWTEVARYFDPFTDHPPYTLLDFQVQVLPETIYVGRSAQVAVDITGPIAPTAADLVFVDADPPVRVAMSRGAEQTFLLELDRVADDRICYIDTPDGRSRRFTIPVVRVPLIEQASIRYEYPAYTGWKASEQPLDGRGIRALVGAEIAITSTSNMPLSHGELRLYPPAPPAAKDEADGKDPPAGQDDAARKDQPAAQAPAPSPTSPLRIVRLEPQPGAAQTVRGQWKIEADGRYELVLIGTNGARSPEPWQGKITAIPDRVPLVEITRPEQRVVAVETEQVPVAIQASDDIGLDRLELWCSVNGWGPSPAALDLTQPDPRVIYANFVFDLPRLGAKAGDTITYRATAYERGPDGGRSVDTPTFILEIISLEEYVEIARSQFQMDELTAEVQDTIDKLDQLAEARAKLEEAIEKLEQKSADQPRSPEEAAALQALEEQLQQFAQATEQLAEQLAERAQQTPLYELEEPHLQRLEKLSQQLQKQADLAKRLAKAAEQARNSPPSSQRESDLEDAAQDFADEKEPFGDDRADLDDLAQDYEAVQQADRLQQQADRVQSLIERQQQLAERMAEFREEEQITPDKQPRADQLAAEQEQLREELAAAQAGLKEAAKEAKETLPKTAAEAEQLAEAIEKLGIQDDQQAAAKECRGGNGQKGTEAAESAAEKLASLGQGSMPGSGGGEELAGQDRGLRLSGKSLKQSLQQMAQARKLPGFGRSKSGQRGRQPGQSGEQLEQGQGDPGGDPGTKPGQGEGFQGSEAKAGLIGPHMPLVGDAKPKSGRHGNDGPADPRDRDPASESFAAEDLSPDSATVRGSGTTMFRGVPTRYRAQVEAYFRRLAEQSLEPTAPAGEKEGPSSGGTPE